MRLRDYLVEVAPKALSARAVRRGWLGSAQPLTLTFSVTAACQSRCLTCHIGDRYLADPGLAERNLTLDEIERVFRKLGPIYFFNVSGGEPFMRPDLAEVVALACRYLRPRLIHIPTNGIAPRFIAETTRRILGYMDEHLPASALLTIKPSIDGVGARHDAIRGYRGNFAKLERTIDALLAIQRTAPRLQVDLGTVISNYNLEHLDEIEAWVHGRGIESYRHEIAEQRAEFHNLGDPITPPGDVYAEVARRFADEVVRHIAGKRWPTRVTEAVRLVYYEVAAEIVGQRRQVSPCFGGITNVHVNFDGEVWPCCVLGGERSLGQLREANYDLAAILRSPQARQVRRGIAAGECACPLANQWLVNILVTPRHMARVLWTLLVRFRRPPAPARATSADAQGRRATEALVMESLGTIPFPTRVRLPVIAP